MRGEELKAKRKSQGWTQLQLAQKIGVSKGTILNYEKGKKIPKSKNKILHEVFEGIFSKNFGITEKRNTQNQDFKTYVRDDKKSSSYTRDEILSKFHPIEIVAYLDKNREQFFYLEEFRLLAKNIVGINEIERLKEEVRAIKKRLDQTPNN